MTPKPTTTFLKNIAAAPYVYFDGAPCFGALAGVVEVTLAARTIAPKADNSTAIEASCVAHLRCPLHAAVSLRDALNQALAMLETQSSRALLDTPSTAAKH
jgi:hypothetical protein